MRVHPGVTISGRLMIYGKYVNEGSLTVDLAVQILEGGTFWNIVTSGSRCGVPPARCQSVVNISALVPGILIVDGDFYNTGSVLNSGEIDIEANGVLTNLGAIQNQYGGVLNNQNQGTLDNGGGGVIENQNTAVINDQDMSSFTNSGTLLNDVGSTLNVKGGATFENLFDGNSTGLVFNQGTIYNFVIGVLTAMVISGGTLENAPQGSVIDYGIVTISGTGVINNSGTFHVTSGAFLDNFNLFNNFCGANLQNEGTISGYPVTDRCATVTTTMSLGATSSTSSTTTDTGSSHTTSTNSTISTASTSSVTETTSNPNSLSPSVPEFPYQATFSFLLSLVIVASYLGLRKTRQPPL